MLEGVILTGVLANWVYELIKGLASRGFGSGKEADALTRKIFDAFDQACVRFHNKYGDAFGGISHSFLVRKNNWETIIESMYYSRDELTPESLDPYSFDGAKEASKEAVAFFVGVLREEMRNIWELDKILAEKQALKKILRSKEEILDALKEKTELLLTSQRDRLESSTISILPTVDTSHFTGRDAALGTLVRLLIDHRKQGVVGIWGGPGVGKSTLASKFAKEYADRFPDGIISLDARDKSAEDLAIKFAEQIREPIDPERLPQPSVIMQSRFKQRRALLILDNATSMDTYKLVPGGFCSVIITTRNRELLERARMEEEAKIHLKRFNEPEALLFLERLNGVEALREEKSAAQEVVRQVGGLPLALRVIGTRVKQEFLLSEPFAFYARRLRSEKERLSHLRFRDDDELNVRAVFQLSLERLKQEDHQAFAGLSVCVESGFALETAAASIGLDKETAAQHLSLLVNLALLNLDATTGRLRFHPLLLLFAREKAEESGIGAEAQERHDTYFTAFVSKHAGFSRVGELVTEEDAIIQTARREIAQRRLNLAFWHGLRHLLEHRGHWHTGIELMQGYLTIAERERADLITAHFCLQLGKYMLLLGKANEALLAFRQSLVVMEWMGNERGEAMVLNSLGGAFLQKGRVDEAIAVFERSLGILKRLKDERGEAMVLNSLGGAFLQGRIDEAIAVFERSLKIGENLKDERHMAMVLNSLGGAFLQKGRVDEAIAGFERSLEIRKSLKDERGEAMMSKRLRTALSWQESLQKEDVETLTAIDHRRVGKQKMRSGEFEKALEHFMAALQLGIEPSERGRLHGQVGQAAFKLENYPLAAEHFKNAIEQGEDTAFTNANLGRSLYAMQASPEIIRYHFEKAIEYDQENAWAHNWYATFLKERGDLVRAEHHAREAVHLKPTHAVFLNNLALVLIEYGERPRLLEAKAILKKAQENAPPDFPWPQHHLEQVEKLLQTTED